MKRYACLVALILFVVFFSISLANMPVNNPVPDADNKATPPDEVSKIINAPVATEQPVDRGQLLYENHCTTCHESSVHHRQTNKARSVKDIRQWVIHWSIHLKLNWGDDDVDVVTEYVNRRFYQFTTEE